MSVKAYKGVDASTHQDEFDLIAGRKEQILAEDVIFDDTIAQSGEDSVQGVIDAIVQGFNFTSLFPTTQWFQTENIGFSNVVREFNMPAGKYLLFVNDYVYVTPDQNPRPDLCYFNIQYNDGTLHNLCNITYRLLAAENIADRYTSYVVVCVGSDSPFTFSILNNPNYNNQKSGTLNVRHTLTVNYVKLP